MLGTALVSSRLTASHEAVRIYFQGAAPEALTGTSSPPRPHCGRLVGNLYVSISPSVVFVVVIIVVVVALLRSCVRHFPPKRSLPCEV